jgi:hypothetical protein
VTKTREKLEEAKFFLEQLEADYKSARFQYYLSAYISAARSVTWVMRHEYNDVVGWEEWFSKKPEEPFLKQTNALRVQAVKKGSPELHFRVAFRVRVDDA